MLTRILAIAALIALNVALFVAPIDYGALGSLAYPGAFLITLLSNAAVVLPVPYIPVVAHLILSVEQPTLVVALAALGSAIGESVAFFVGRAQKGLFVGAPMYERIRGFFDHEWRAAIFLFFFAVPLNPLFDVGGLAAGALGISFPTFFVAVGLGRLVRFTILAALALGLLR